MTVEVGTKLRPMKRVAAACFVGTAIEFYDFLIYGTAAALVFPTVFFPHLNPSLATIASMGTFAAAFLSRPLGAVVFGHFGDRLGRKKTLVITLLIMAVSTVTVGVVPSTAVIGSAAPLILVMLRLLQGFAAGGEWTGSALLSAEYAPNAKRGMYGMFTLLGSSTAVVMANLTFLGLNHTMGEHNPAFMQWGWRIPFLISTVLIVIALHVRLNIDETPAFIREKARGIARNAVLQAPVIEVLRHKLWKVALAAGSIVGYLGLAYTSSTYLTTYAHTHLGYSRDFILLVGVLGGLASIVCIAFSAILSDRVGRRRIMLAGGAMCLPWSLLAIPLINTGSPILFAVAMVGMHAIAAFGCGPTPSFIPELFATHYRYTGTALAINLAGVVGGALPPTIAGTLMAIYGSWSVGLMLTALAMVGLMCTLLFPETEGPFPETKGTAITSQCIQGIQGTDVSERIQPSVGV